MWTHRRVVTDSSGTNTYFSDTPPATDTPPDVFPPSALLSPSGARIAALQGNAHTLGVGTNLYDNGKLVGAVDGCVAGWLDENHVLANVYTFAHSMMTFQKAVIYDNQGTLVATPPLPEILEFQTVSANQIYDRRQRAIFDVNTGASLWSATPPPGGPSALTQARAVLTDDHRVHVIAHP
jgi:hypothetical protein